MQCLARETPADREAYLEPKANSSSRIRTMACETMDTQDQAADVALAFQKKCCGLCEDGCQSRSYLPSGHNVESRLVDARIPFAHKETATNLLPPYALQ